MSGPQLLDAPLRPPEEPIHVQAVGVGRHLGRDPDHQSPTSVFAKVVSPSPKTPLRAAKQISTCCLVAGRRSAFSVASRTPRPGPRPLQRQEAGPLADRAGGRGVGPRPRDGRAPRQAAFLDGRGGAAPARAVPRRAGPGEPMTSGKPLISGETALPRPKRPRGRWSPHGCRRVPSGGS